MEGDAIPVHWLFVGGLDTFVHVVGSSVNALSPLDLLKLIESVICGPRTHGDIGTTLFPATGSILHRLFLEDSLVDLAILRDAVRKPFRGSHFVIGFSHSTPSA